MIETIAELRAACLAAGNTEWVEICDRALAGDDDAREQCDVVLGCIAGSAEHARGESVALTAEQVDESARVRGRGRACEGSHVRPHPQAVALGALR